MNAHIVKSACLAAIAASLATSSPAWAEDVKGSGPSRADPLRGRRDPRLRTQGLRRSRDARPADPARSRGQGPGAGGQADPHLLPHRRQEIGAGGLPQLSGRVAGRRFQDPVRMQGRRAVRRRFPVLRHQRRKGTPARPGRCHVRRQVLRGAGQGSAHRRHLRVPGRDGRRLQPHHAGVPAGARNQADANGAGPGAGHGRHAEVAGRIGPRRDLWRVLRYRQGRGQA